MNSDPRISWRGQLHALLQTSMQPLQVQILLWEPSLLQMKWEVWLARRCGGCPLCGQHLMVLCAWVKQVHIVPHHQPVALQARLRPGGGRPSGTRHRKALCLHLSGTPLSACHPSQCLKRVACIKGHSDPLCMAAECGISCLLDVCSSDIRRPGAALPLMRTEHHLSGGHRPRRLQVEGRAAGVRGQLAVLHGCTHLQPPLPSAALEAALRMPFTNQAAAVSLGSMLAEDLSRHVLQATLPPGLLSAFTMQGAWWLGWVERTYQGVLLLREDGQYARALALHAERQVLPQRGPDADVALAAAAVVPVLRLRGQSQPVQHLQQARAPQPVLLC